MAAMGPKGMQEAARQCHAKAHYLAKELCNIPGVSMLYNGEFFHEFVTVMPKVKQVLVALEKQGILGGLPLEEGILWCVTEKVSKTQLDKAIAIVREELRI